MAYLDSITIIKLKGSDPTSRSHALNGKKTEIGVSNINDLLEDIIIEKLILFVEELNSCLAEEEKAKNEYEMKKKKKLELDSKITILMKELGAVEKEGLLTLKNKKVNFSKNL